MPTSPTPPAATAAGALTVTAGPFGSLEAVRAFEQTLAGLPGVASAEVRGYESGDRAVVDVDLSARNVVVFSACPTPSPSPGAPPRSTSSTSPVSAPRPQRAFSSDPSGLTAYGTAVGYQPLRAWIAERHGVSPSQVLVTNGSMQADAFLFDALVGAGDTVIVERPTYDRTLLSLRSRGADVRMVELEPDGIDVAAVERLLSAGLQAKLAHIIPNFQNPAGYTLSAGKRDAAARAGPRPTSS